MARHVPRILRSRRAVAAIVLVAVAVGGGTTWLVTHGSSDAQAATRTVQTVTAQTVSQSVSTTGTIAPAVEANLSFQVSGTVTSVKVAVGDKVQKGQALATVANTALKSAVSVAKASLVSAEATLASTSGSSVQVASAKAQVASAKSALASAKADLAAATLRSTITGTVASVSIEKGDTAGSGSTSSSPSSSSSGAASSSSSSSSATATSSASIVVISTSSWVVNTSVGSADLGSLKKGLQATITPTDSTTKVYGTVKSVGVVASSDSSSSATFPVVIAVTGSPAGLYAGGSASVSIVVKQLSNVLTVPTAALHSSGGKTYVYQLKNGKQVDTDVTVGTTFGNSTQIAKGLSSGDQVVVTTVTPTRTGGTGTGSGNGAGFGGGGFGGTGGPPTGAGGAGGGPNG